MTRRNVVATILTAALIAVGAGLVQGCEQQETRASQEPMTPQVTVAEPVVREIVEWDEYTGRFAPVERVEIRARVSGYLDALPFQEGAIVGKGDLIAVVDQRPFRIAVESAEAAVTDAQAAADLAQIELGRARDLQKSPAFSRDLFDQRNAAARSSAAQLAAAEAALARARLDLEFSEIRAPIDGRVGRYEVTQGNLIVGGEQGGTLLTTIVSVDPIHFYFDVSEADYLRYNRLNIAGTRVSSRDEANPVQLRLLDESDFVHEGRMNFVANELAEATATLQGRAIFANPDGFFQPGQFGTARLLGSGRYEAVMVPDDVLLSDQASKFVFVVDANNQVERRMVKLGPIVDGLRVVRKGLNPGERVVIGGIQRIRPGMEVTTRTQAIDTGDG
jgi:RND family efflux transporter MFP subunit